MSLTQVQVTTDTRKELKGLKLVKMETYDEIIKRLILNFKNKEAKE